MAPLDPRRDRRLAGLLALACGALYLATLCPGVYWYDSAEYAAEAATLGVAHPPGYPLYVPLAHLFTRLPLEPALGVNLMSAVCGALAVGLLFLVGRRLGARPGAAAIGALTLAVAAPFWQNATVAEVYTGGLVFGLGALLLLLDGEAQGDLRRLFAAAALAGLGMGMHMSVGTLGLGFALLVAGGVLRRRPGGLRSARSWATILAVGLTGVAATVATFLTIPLRTFRDLGSRHEWAVFWANARGGRFRGRMRPGEDDWARLLDLQVDALTWIGVIAALVGAVVLVRRNRLVGAALLLAAAGNLRFFLHYQVQDPEVFFLPTTALACAFLGVSADALAERLAPALGALDRRLAAALALAPAAALPAYLLVANYQGADRSGDRSAAEYGEMLVAKLPEGAVMIKYNRPPEWERYAVFLYYQKAHRLRRDVEILTRPEAAELAQRLDEGQRIFAFRVPGGLRSRFKMVIDGDLIELRPREPRARPQRSGRAAGAPE